MRNVRVLGIIGLATIGLTAACGGSSGPNGTGSASPAPAEAEAAPVEQSSGTGLDAVRDDPCRMVTKAEAEAIFGRTVEAPSKGRAVGIVEATCTYAVETARPSEVRTMTVSVMFSPDRVGRGMNGKTFMENLRKDTASEVGVPQSVAGLGEEAFCVPATTGSLMFSRIGDVVISVGGRPDDCAVARQFAERAIAHL